MTTPLTPTQAEIARKRMRYGHAELPQEPEMDDAELSPLTEIRGMANGVLISILVWGAVAAVLALILYSSGVL